jgi:hypothetical protein
MVETLNVSLGLGRRGAFDGGVRVDSQKSSHQRWGRYHDKVLVLLEHDLGLGEWGGLLVLWIGDRINQRR